MTMPSLWLDASGGFGYTGLEGVVQGWAAKSTNWLWRGKPAVVAKKIRLYQQMDIDNLP
jgi:hypothetical protein